MSTRGNSAALFAVALLAQPAFAGVYSADDFHNGLRAYEAIHGGHRQRDPQLEGSAFEFVGYVKALTDAHNGSAFCVGRGAFPRAVTLVVQQYNDQPGWRDVEPAAVVMRALGRAFPCGTMPVVSRP